MTEKELKSLSKKQIITLLTKQDSALEKLSGELAQTKKEHDQVIKELEQVNSELSNAKQQLVELGASPSLISDIVKAANDAADKYVADAEQAIEERKKRLLELEEIATAKIKEAEDLASRVVSSTCSILDKHVQNVHSLYAEFHAGLRTADMARFLPPEKQGDSPINEMRIDGADAEKSHDKNTEEVESESCESDSSENDSSDSTGTTGGYDFFYE